MYLFFLYPFNLFIYPVIDYIFSYLFNVFVSVWIHGFLFYSLYKKQSLLCWLRYFRFYIRNVFFMVPVSSWDITIDSFFISSIFDTKDALDYYRIFPTVSLGSTIYPESFCSLYTGEYYLETGILWWSVHTA